jgi:hypothetical protein
MTLPTQSSARLGALEMLFPVRSFLGAVLLIIWWSSSFSYTTALLLLIVNGCSISVSDGVPNV